MYVNRDFLDVLVKNSILESVLIWGPRQVGKTTLLDQLPLKTKVFLDDLGQRERAHGDPGFFLDNLELPCLIDEVQYSPNLFPEMKLRIDRLRRERLSKKNSQKPLYYLTGSNRLLLDERVKESLAGRCHYFTLHGFSVKEILSGLENKTLREIIFKGGFPELYTNPSLSVQRYLNDYILSYIEKDIALLSGIEKLREFQTVLKLLAARTGQFLKVSEVSSVAGVESKTVLAWMSILERNFILESVPVFSSNLSKRIVKMKKLYFYDTGLAARLQGFLDEESMWNSPQIGALFETLVFSEIIKTRDNFLRDWQLFTWRTKEQNEIDFVIQTGKAFLLIEVKLGIHGAKSFEIDSEAKKVFKNKFRKIVVTAGGSVTSLDKETTLVPIQSFAEYLLKIE